MAGVRSAVGDLARKACEEFPRTSSRMLGSYLAAKYPMVYAKPELAYLAVRYYRGSVGMRNRKKAEKVGALVAQDTKIPEGIKLDYSPFVITGKVRALMVSDLHIPYHDKAALDAAISAGVSARCETLIINGDLFDFYQLSDFLKDPTMRRPKEEIEVGLVVLKHLSKLFKRIIWKFGNHDDRYANYLMANAPLIWEIDKRPLSEIMHLDKIGVETVEDKRIIKLGKLNVIHGHEYKQSVMSPVNPARGLFLRSHEMALCGHHHRSSEHTETSIGEGIITTWSLGCLCDLHPRYMPLNNWNHGFAIVTVEANGRYNVDNRRVYNGRVL